MAAAKSIMNGVRQDSHPEKQESDNGAHKGREPLKLIEQRKGQEAGPHYQKSAEAHTNAQHSLEYPWYWRVQDRNWRRAAAMCLLQRTGPMD